MELMGIADEASPSIDGQIRASRELGWKWIEARFAEVNGFEKGPVHDIPEEAFDIMAGKLEDAGVGVYALGSTICNWAKNVDTPWESPSARSTALSRACSGLVPSSSAS